MKVILVRESDNSNVEIGDTLETFRGEKVVLQGFKLPYDAEFLNHPVFKNMPNVQSLNLNRGAKIYCKDENDHQNQWYPAVCGLKFIVVIDS